MVRGGDVLEIVVGEGARLDCRERQLLMEVAGGCQVPLRSVVTCVRMAYGDVIVRSLNADGGDI
jgi:hypothetical protein